MEAVQDGMNLDPQVLIQVQQNFIASARIKEVQLEAAVMQLGSENASLQAKIDELTATDKEATQEG
ncbi:unnamed protein product [marine sediment metagenome]|uniref:Uncharacterized protein n=1 Tax=marine sediment metagenome TaxID=412755 RepID=X0WG94_9ZZZZ